MPNQFASGRWAISQCDVCGQRYKLKQLKSLVIKRKSTNILACPECWNPDHPQLLLGERPVNDPQAVRNPRPETGYIVGGIGADGEPTGGSRVIQWGWNPVGGSRDGGLTPNDLNLVVSVGTVTVAIT